MKKLKESKLKTSRKRPEASTDRTAVSYRYNYHVPERINTSERASTVKLGLYVHGLVRTLGYCVLSVDRGHRKSDFFALSLFWIKRSLFRTHLFSFSLRVRNNRVSL